MNKGFTLLELLVVVGIMGLMGTASVGGYRQMQRGMEERGVKDNVQQFITMVRQRAQIDRMPTAVIFWNEMLREESDTADALYVGKAIAVRCQGRISHKQGQKIYDEFGNLEEFDDDGDFMEYTTDEPETTLYRFDLSKQEVEASTVRRCADKEADYFVTRDPRYESKADSLKGKFLRFGYEVTQNEGQAWKVGDLYGVEFQQFQLSHGYVFGSGGKLPTSMGKPSVNVEVLFFEADGTGQTTVELSSVRPGSNGAPEAQSIGKTETITDQDS